MDPQQGPSNSADQLIGQTIGNYLVTQKLGEGGMGAVYLAEHPSIGKKVALKVLHNEFSTNQEVAARFFHEAKAVNDIGHPNIVDIIDYGTMQLGREPLVYFFMEYLAGTTLSGLIRNEAPIPPERAFAIALQVADALAASHKCGIVHRDLKPDNIILIQRHRERDFVKLLDFGIAKLTGESAGSHRTRTGIVMGTPAYMSPEQCEGRGNIDHRTDIYALGILVYEMLVGRVPFIGEGYGEILVQHLTQPPVPPSQYRMLNPHVEMVVMKALEKRPDMRYPTMDEFIRAMSDPVGYVEANGGLNGFMQRQLMPSNAPIPMRPSSFGQVPMMSGGMQPTPAPGTLSNKLVTPVPTTLGAATGAATVPPTGGSKIGFIVAGVVVVAAAAVAIIVVATNKGSEPGGSTGDSGSQVAAAADAANNDPMPVPDAAVAVKPPVIPDAATHVATVVPDAAEPVKMTTFKFAVTPKEAKIYVDDEEKPASFELPRSTKTVKIKFKAEGYEELIKDYSLDENIDKPIALKKKTKIPVIPTNPNPGKGSNGKGSGSQTPGKGSQTVPNKGSNDTGLERPGD
jgi:eukaryotic-like serine/threonine-protein kinase